MRLVISKDRTIHDVQVDFNRQFPFLKLEFYKPQNIDPKMPVRKHLSHSTSLKDAGLKLDSIVLDINRDMTVVSLEKMFFNKLGLDAQVSRKSGLLWLETTMTDNWTLDKQNEHGREISLPEKIFRGDNKGDEWGIGRAG
jgi:hypothetical protein